MKIIRIITSPYDIAILIIRQHKSTIQAQSVWTNCVNKLCGQTVRTNCVHKLCAQTLWTNCVDKLCEQTVWTNCGRTTHGQVYISAVRTQYCARASYQYPPTYTPTHTNTHTHTHTRARARVHTNPAAETRIRQSHTNIHKVI